MAEVYEVPGGQPRPAFIVHRHAHARGRTAILIPQRADPGIGHMVAGEDAQDFLIVAVRRGEDRAVGLQRGERSAQFALQMILMRVDQFEDQAIAMFGAFQHAAQQHLVDPVGALARAPVGDGAFAVVEREDEIGFGPAHPLRRDRGDIAQPVDRRLDALAHFRADIGFIVDDAAHRLQRDARVRRNMLDRDRQPPPRHRLFTVPRFRARAPRPFARRAPSRPASFSGSRCRRRPCHCVLRASDRQWQG